MKRSSTSPVLKLFVGVIIVAILGVVSITLIKKVKVNHTRRSIAESIAYIEQNFSCLDSTLTRSINPEVVRGIDSARCAAKVACDCLEKVYKESEYLELMKAGHPFKENRNRVDKDPSFMAGVYVGLDENEFKYQKSIDRVLMEYLRLGTYISDTTIIPWPAISLSNYIEQKKVRDKKSTQLLTDCLVVLADGKDKGETIKPIRKAKRIRKKRENDIEILSFDDSVLDFIIRYDRLLMDYCQQQSEQKNGN